MAKKKIDLDVLTPEQAVLACPEYRRVVRLLQDNSFEYNHASPALRDKNNGAIIEMWKTDSPGYCEKVLVCRNRKYVLLQIAGTFYPKTKEIRTSFSKFLLAYEGGHCEQVR